MAFCPPNTTANSHQVLNRVARDKIGVLRYSKCKSYIKHYISIQCMDTCLNAMTQFWKMVKAHNIIIYCSKPYLVLYTLYHLYCLNIHSRPGVTSIKRSIKCSAWVVMLVQGLWLDLLYNTNNLSHNFCQHVKYFFNKKYHQSMLPYSYRQAGFCV